jgi:thioester reductase-like protein
VRTIFLTGATGAIGSALTKNLLDEPDTRLRLLMRAGSPGHLQERLTDLFQFLAIDVQSVAGRVEAFAGDATQEKFGLSASDYSRLTSEVTHVVHAAGNVKLNRPFEEARLAAVSTARHVAKFVERCASREEFQKLDFVSTVGVAGRIPGTVPERPLPEAHAFRNTYEAAKAEAELVLLAHMEKGVPATIHRPSMVVGDSNDGAIIHFQVFYHLCEFLSGRRSGGVIPNAGDIRLDIVPVDYVARAIQRSSACRDAVGRVFHLCSGPILSPTINQLAIRIHDVFRAHGRRVPSLHPVPLGVIRAVVQISRRLVPGSLGRALRQLPYFLAYLDEPQTFANTATTEFFSARGLLVPSVDSYLDRVLGYYLSRA